MEGAERKNREIDGDGGQIDRGMKCKEAGK